MFLACEVPLSGMGPLGVGGILGYEWAYGPFST